MLKWEAIELIMVSLQVAFKETLINYLENSVSESIVKI